MEVVCNGTSMAVPHAVGAASLLWEMDKDKTADFIKGLLEASAKTVEDDGDEYSYIDVEYAKEIYDEYCEKYTASEDVEELNELYENDDEVEAYDEAVTGSWSKANHKAIVDYMYYDVFGCHYDDVQIVKLGAVAPDVHIPYSVTKEMGMFHAKDEHNYVRTCEYIMNMATHCKKYGHNSTMSSNCKPDNVKDPDYTTIKSWLEPGDIKAMLGTQYEYNDYNASLVMLGIAMHVMSDAYAHQSRVVQDDGTLKKPEVNDNVNDGTKRYYYAKEACLNLWSNYYNNVKTTGADFDGNGKKFKLKKLYTYSLESRNGKSKSWYLFDILKEYSCGD